jgi:hypothetical protein
VSQNHTRKCSIFSLESLKKYALMGAHRRQWVMPLSCINEGTAAAFIDGVRMRATSFTRWLCTLWQVWKGAPQLPLPNIRQEPCVSLKHTALLL